jgi:hypothetical protein
MAQGALDPQLDAWVRSGAGGATPCERAEQTSISWLFFFPGRVLKLKKPVDLGFVDFSTPERRGWAARREVAFNRATAPDIYRRVVTITRGPHGALADGGEGEAADYAVEMRRFDEAAILSRRLPLDGAFAEALGRRIARFHAAAASGRAGAGSAGLAYVTTSNAAQLRACAGDLDGETIEALIAATDQALAAAAPILDARAALGFCRACHGDLHLSNILEENGQPVLFDCIEFSDQLREIDVGYDIAFLLMDMAFRGDGAGANRAFNAWLDEAARAFAPSLWPGLVVLPLFQSVRAAVRAHVSAREGKAEAARRYVDAAIAWLTGSPPRLVAVGGLSGTGKTTHARQIAPALGAAPGAVVLRSDEIRKRQWGVAPTQALGAQAYSPQAGERVYEALTRLAGEVLGAGRSVVADAAFLEPERRAGIEAVARAAGVAFEGVWLEAPADELRRRVASRHGDASDADLQVLEAQLAGDPGEIGWRRRES